MSLIRDFLGKTETIAAATADTLIFDKGLPSGPFKRFNFTAVGANNSIAGTGIVKYIVKKNSTVIWDLLPTQLRALLEALISPIGGSVPATSALRYTYPCDLLVPGGDIGFPRDIYTLETEVDTDASAGSLKVGWEFADVNPKLFPRMVREQIGAPASSSAGYDYYTRTGKGIAVLGWILDLVNSTTGIRSIQIFRATHDRGPVEDLGKWAYEEILESQAHYNPEAITTPFFFKPFAKPLDYPEGSYLKIVNGAGSAETDQIVPIELHPA